MVSHSLPLMMLENTPLPLQRAHRMARLVGGAQVTPPDTHPGSFLPVAGHGVFRGRYVSQVESRGQGPVTVW